MKIVRIRVALLVCCILLAACGAQPAAMTPTNAPAPATAAAATAAPTFSAPATTGAAAITIQDQRGKTITLDRPAERIVTIPIPAASLLIAVDGSAERLVGINPSSAQAINNELLGEIFPEAKDIVSDIAGENFAPNVESILALQPDVVIQWGDRGDEIIAPLENVGLKVIGLRYGSQEDLETWIRIFGTLIGKAERAAQLIGWQQESLQALQAQAANVSGARPKIIYFNRLKGELRVAGANTYNDFYIRLVGGVNPAAELKGFATVNAEQVLAWNPDIMLVGNFDGATPADVYANVVWQDLSAIKTRRVYQVPLGGYRWDPPSQEAPLMWRWLATLSFPDIYTFDLRNEIRQNYQLLYNTIPSDEQIDRVLHLEVNQEGAFYDRFARK